MTELKQLSRVTGFAALATMVLLFVPIVAASDRNRHSTVRRQRS